MHSNEEIDLFMDVTNPLEFVEDMMAFHDWSFERLNEDEITVNVSGDFGHYDMRFVWQDDVNALEFTCKMDIEIHATKRAKALEAINDMNAKLWLGHFDLPNNDTQPRFRHTSLLRGMTEGSGTAFLEDLIQVALAECERYYMAFDLLATPERHSPLLSHDTMDLALMDVSGIA